jgi:predicted dehydrogenase
MTNNKYNWAILGTGKIASIFASDLKLLPNANLYAVGSRSIGLAKEFASKHVFQKAYGSYEELVADPAVDIVYVASPHVKHYGNSLLCLNNGKAVLCEKPVAMNEQQFRMMIDSAKKNKVFFMEALWTRFIPSFIKCKELIEEGAIGDIKLIESDFCFKAIYDIEGRLFNPLLGGGALLDIGIYPVFLALQLSGKPISIKAFALKADTGVDSACSMLFKHSDNALSVLFCSLINDGQTEAFIHGTEGTIHIKSMWHMSSVVDLIREGEETVHFQFIKPGIGYQYEATEVMKCLDEGKIESSIFSWQNSLDLISTLDAIRKEAGISYPKEIEKL